VYMFFVILFAEDGRQGTDTYLKIEDWQRPDRHRHNQGMVSGAKELEKQSRQKTLPRRAKVLTGETGTQAPHTSSES